MRVRHPRAHPDVPGKPPAKIDVGGGYGSTRELDDDGTFPAERAVAERLSDRFDVPFDVVDAGVSTDESEDADETDPDSEWKVKAPDDEEPEDGGTCEVVKADGDVCGRELPCQYHSDEEE